jgi:hypothetical protein
VFRLAKNSLSVNLFHSVKMGANAPFGKGFNGY